MTQSPLEINLHCQAQNLFVYGPLHETRGKYTVKKLTDAQTKCPHLQQLHTNSPHMVALHLVPYEFGSYNIMVPPGGWAGHTQGGDNVPQSGPIFCLDLKDLAWSPKTAL